MQRRRLVLTAAVVIATSILGPASARAGSVTSPTRPAPVSASSSASSSSGGLTAAASPLDITCYPNVQDAHESGHVPGTVNVVATVQCLYADGLPAPVTSLSLRVQLWYGTSYSGEFDYEQDYYNGGQSYISGNSAASCIPGYWFGYIYLTVVFPPGYTPQVGYSQGGSARPATLVTCT